MLVNELEQLAVDTTAAMLAAGGVSDLLGWGQAAGSAAAWRDSDGRAPTTANIHGEHDVAFLRLYPDKDGNSAEDVLGAQGFTFNSPAGRPVTVTG